MGSTIDTALNPFTYQAALRAAGAVVLGVDLVMAGKVDNAFCNILPFTVLRRLDCVLEATKSAVLAEKEKREKAGLNPEP